VARLRRALDEYRVVGVKTTLPFFRWLVREPAFHEGRFSTTYLDDLLARRDAPFVAPDEADERDALVAAALSAWFRAHRAAADPPAPAGGAWRQAARAESCR
jgi:acetyl/propionyl-CoA carboxylase alpha subunit